MNWNNVDVNSISISLRYINHLGDWVYFLNVSGGQPVADFNIQHVYSHYDLVTYTIPNGLHTSISLPLGSNSMLDKIRIEKCA